MPGLSRRAGGWPTRRVEGRSIQHSSAPGPNTLTRHPEHPSRENRCPDPVWHTLHVLSHPNPFVFVVGAPRSSTTLVQRLLDAHPLLAVINETRWIAEWFEAGVGMGSDGSVTTEHLELLTGSSGFVKLELPEAFVREMVSTAAGMDYATLVSTIFDEYGRVRGKELVGDKTPRYVLHIDVLHSLFPAARFVHVIRDGREVALSVEQWNAKRGARGPGYIEGWGDDPVTTTALWWGQHVRRGREAGGRIGQSTYHELRYEHLTTDPEGACRDLCTFLGLDFDEAMLRFNEGRERTDGKRSAKSSWLSPTPGLRDWTTAMDPADIEAFEAAEGSLLDVLGYPRAAPHPSAGSIRRVEKRRRTFNVNMRSGANVVPEGWPR